MDYAAASDLLVDAAWTIGKAATASTLVMIVGLFLLRWHATNYAAWRKARTEHWRLRLLEAMSGDAVVAPRDVPRGEREVFLDVWCRLQAALRGDARQALNDVLVATRLDDICRRWLRLARPVDRRLLAIVALGHLGTRDDWPRLLAMLDAAQGWQAMAALQGLLRIDPSTATTLVLERLHDRPEWPRDTIRAALREAGPDAVTAPLLAWLATAPPAALAHGLPLVETGHSAAIQEALLPLLRADTPVESLAAAIRQADGPRVLPAVRALADHPAWEVRTQVANALGHLGDAGDVDTLRRLLGDRWWWVRYRAAQALLTLPPPVPASLPALLASLEDRYARDALRHAAGERWLALTEAQP